MKKGECVLQQLEVNLSIQIPEHLVLVEKTRLKELEEQAKKGVYWNMQDLMKYVNKREVWIKENILYPQKFKKIIDVESGGFVYYPKRKGEHWSFHAGKMSEFLDRNFHKIFS